VKPAAFDSRVREGKAEERHQNGGRRGKADPGQERPEGATRKPPDQDAGLRAARARQKLRKGDALGKRSVIEPAAALDELAPEVGEVRDRPAERRASKAQEGKEKGHRAGIRNSARMDLSSITVFSRGDFRRYDDARVGLLTHGLQYGTGCFEGIRGYWVPEDRELYLVLLREHYQRLKTSAKILLIEIPYSVDELVEITIELCARNGFKTDIYVRPCAFKAAEDIGVRLHNVPDAFAIVPVPFTSYLDTTKGLDVCVSSWRRADDTMAPPRAKITGLYVNSALAKSEAITNGYDEAILLSHDGHVAEGSAENVFLVREGKLLTPDPSQNVLEGCTRRAIIEVAQNQFGIEVVERSIDRGELYAADELFFTGTAAGIAHIASVDRRKIGEGTMGPITRQLSDFYQDAVHRRAPKYERWLNATYNSATLSRASG
jgi:branched-chain amino acid aminotransferase